LKHKLLLLLLLILLGLTPQIGCSPPFYRNEPNLHLNTQDRSRYKVRLDRTEGEIALVDLAQVAELEEAWIYRDGTWFEIGIESEINRVQFFLPEIQMLLLGAKDVGHYHIHPLIVASSEADRMDKSAGRPLPIYRRFLERMLVVPSEKDIKTAFTICQMRGGTQVVSGVGSPEGITYITPLDPSSLIEVLPLYKENILKVANSVDFVKDVNELLAPLNIPGKLEIRFVSQDELNATLRP